MLQDVCLGQLCVLSLYLSYCNYSCSGFIDAYYSHCRKHVWGNFCLSYGSAKLIEDDAGLQDYGIKNNEQVHLITIKL